MNITGAIAHRLISMLTAEKDGDKLANNDEKIVLGSYIPKTTSQINDQIASLQSQLKALVDASSQLSSMSSQLSSMAEALGTKSENGFVEAGTLSGFDVKVRSLESWNHFQETLGSTTSSYQECEEAANALATEWVNSSDFLAQLTDQNKEYYATQLQAMGVENYEEVTSYAQALNEAKEVLSQSSLGFGDATQDKIEFLIAEGWA